MKNVYNFVIRSYVNNNNIIYDAQNNDAQMITLLVIKLYLS